MTKRLTFLLLTSLLVGLVITTLLILLILSQRPVDQNTMRCDFSGLFYVLGWGVVILLTISSSTLYLNLKEQIRNNRWLSLSSFFLLPLLTAITLLVLMGDLAENLKEYAAIFLPYFTIFFVLYCRYR